MRVTFKPTDEEVRAARRAEYLRGLPVHEQLEALFDAFEGDPAKLDAMIGRIHEIKNTYKKGGL